MNRCTATCRWPEHSSPPTHSHLPICPLTKSLTSSLSVCRDFYRPIGWHNNDALVDMTIATTQYEEALLWCQEQYSAKPGTTDLLQQFSHVLFHNNAPYHSKRNLRLMCESVYGELTRDQHDELYEAHAAQGAGISAQNATTYTCPIYASLLSLVATREAALVSKRLLCFSYGSGCAASMYGIHVQQLPKHPKDVFEVLAKRDVKSVHETLQLVQAYEGAYRSFPFEPTHTEPRLLGVYYLEQVGALGVRQYTKSDSGSVVSNQELGVDAVRIELPQKTLDIRLLTGVVANSQFGVLCVLAQSGTTGVVQSNIGSTPWLAEYDNFQQCYDHSPVVAVYQGFVDELALLPSDITLSVGVNGRSLVTGCSHRVLPESCSSTAGTHTFGLVDGLTSNVIAKLRMDRWHNQEAFCLLNPNVVSLALEPPLLHASIRPVGVELDWPADGVAQLKLDMSQDAALEELQDAAWTLMLHPDLVAVVLCGETGNHQIRSIAVVHSSANISVLMAPLLVY